MKLENPKYKIEQALPYHEMLAITEIAARTCYKSEDKICECSAEKLIRACIKRGHESVLEHCVISVRIVCDRGVSHELVRHRLASYSQESQRYCAYRDEVVFIKPHWFHDSCLSMGKEKDIFVNSLDRQENDYIRLLNLGMPPQDARDVLPNKVKTEIVCTLNLRAWRHMFKLRTAKAAHPEMRRIMRPMLKEFADRWPVFFGDILTELEG